MKILEIRAKFVFRTSLAMNIPMDILYDYECDHYTDSVSYLNYLLLNVCEKHMQILKRILTIHSLDFSYHTYKNMQQILEKQQTNMSNECADLIGVLDIIKRNIDRTFESADDFRRSTLQHLPLIKPAIDWSSAIEFSSEIFGKLSLMNIDEPCDMTTLIQRCFLHFHESARITSTDTFTSLQYDASVNTTKSIIFDIFGKLSSKLRIDHVTHLLYILLSLYHDVSDFNGNTTNNTLGINIQELSKQNRNELLRDYIVYASAIALHMLRCSSKKEVLKMVMEFSSWLIGITYMLRLWDFSVYSTTLEIVLGYVRSSLAAFVMTDSRRWMLVDELLDLIAHNSTKVQTSISRGGHLVINEEGWHDEHTYIDHVYAVAGDPKLILSLVCLSDLMAQLVVNDAESLDIVFGRVADMMEQLPAVAVLLAQGAMYRLISVPKLTQELTMSYERARVLCLQLTSINIHVSLWMESAVSMLSFPSRDVAHNNTEMTDFHICAVLEFLGMIDSNSHDDVSKWICGRISNEPVGTLSLLVTSMQVCLKLLGMKEEVDRGIVLKVDAVMRLVRGILDLVKSQEQCSSYRNHVINSFAGLVSEVEGKLSCVPLSSPIKADVDHTVCSPTLVADIKALRSSFVFATEPNLSAKVKLLILRLEPNSRELARLVGAVSCLDCPASNIVQAFLVKEKSEFEHFMFASQSGEKKAANIKDLMRYTPLESSLMPPLKGDKLFISGFRVDIMFSTAFPTLSQAPNLACKTFVCVHILRYRLALFSSSVNVATTNRLSIFQVDHPLLSAIHGNSDKLVAPALLSAAFCHFQSLLIHPSLNALLYFVSAIEIMMGMPGAWEDVLYLVHSEALDIFVWKLLDSSSYSDGRLEVAIIGLLYIVDVILMLARGSADYSVLLLSVRIVHVLTTVSSHLLGTHRDYIANKIHVHLQEFFALISTNLEAVNKWKIVELLPQIAYLNMTSTCRHYFLSVRIDNDFSEMIKVSFKCSSSDDAPIVNFSVTAERCGTFPIDLFTLRNGLSITPSTSTLIDMASLKPSSLSLAKTRIEELIVSSMRVPGVCNSVDIMLTSIDFYSNALFTSDFQENVILVALNCAAMKSAKNRVHSISEASSTVMVAEAVLLKILRDLVISNVDTVVATVEKVAAYMPTTMMTALYVLPPESLQLYRTLFIYSSERDVGRRVHSLVVLVFEKLQATAQDVRLSSLFALCEKVLLALLSLKLGGPLRTVPQTLEVCPIVELLKLVMKKSVSPTDSVEMLILGVERSVQECCWHPSVVDIFGAVLREVTRADRHVCFGSSHIPRTAVQVMYSAPNTRAPLSTSSVESVMKVKNKKHAKLLAFEQNNQTQKLYIGETSNDSSDNELIDFEDLLNMCPEPFDSLVMEGEGESSSDDDLLRLGETHPSVDHVRYGHKRGLDCVDKWVTTSAVTKKWKLDF